MMPIVCSSVKLPFHIFLRSFPPVFSLPCAPPHRPSHRRSGTFSLRRKERCEQRQQRVDPGFGSAKVVSEAQLRQSRCDVMEAAQRQEGDERQWG